MSKPHYIYLRAHTTITSSASANISVVKSIALKAIEVLKCTTTSYPNSALSAPISTVLEGISISSDGVTLTAASINTASALLEHPDNLFSIQHEKALSFRQAIFSILLPLISLVLPLIHAQYLHDIDSAEQAKQWEIENETHSEATSLLGYELDLLSQLLEEEKKQALEEAMQTQEELNQTEILEQINAQLEQFNAYFQSQNSPSVHEDASTIPDPTPLSLQESSAIQHPHCFVPRELPAVPDSVPQTDNNSPE